MGQFSGRIHIKVKEIQDWDKLKNLPEGLESVLALEYIDDTKTDVVLWGEGEVCFGDLNMGQKIDKIFDPSYVCDMCSVVKVLADALSECAIIIADSTYNGSDPCTSRVCYLGNNLKYEYFSWGKAAELFDTTDINNIREWLASGGFEISPSEKEYLRQFSINLDNYSPLRFFGINRQIRVSKKNAPVVTPTMDKSSVEKIITTHCNALVGKIFVVTGKLYHFANRNELKTLIESNGAKLSETLNSSTDYLITNEPNSGSSKNNKAQTLGIKIITEEEFIKMISSDDKTANPSSQAVDNPYAVILDEDELRELEGTEDALWFLYQSDNRHKDELHVDFEKYFSSELFSKYSIMQYVNPEYFGEHPACKPLDFLFLKDNKPVLGINIVPYTGIPHPAIRNIKYACERMGIKYLHFIVYYPNKEHYVVRRALEELGEIPYLYN